MWRDLIDCLAAEEQCNAVTLEALAESERLRSALEEDVKTYQSGTEFLRERAEKAEAQLRLSIIDAANNEAEANDLRATFDRTVAAWKREELGWDEERKALTAERDDLLAYWKFIHSGESDTGLQDDKAWDALNARIEARRSGGSS
jgi:hypothetical protein